jgi:hypothetical protein
MHSKVSWWSYVLFLVGVVLIFWYSGGVRPAY